MASPSSTASLTNNKLRLAAGPASFLFFGSFFFCDKNLARNSRSIEDAMKLRFDRQYASDDAHADTLVARMSLLENINTSRNGVPLSLVGGVSTLAVTWCITKLTQEQVKATYAAVGLTVYLSLLSNPAQQGPQVDRVRRAVTAAFTALPQNRKLRDEVLILLTAMFAVQPGTVLYVYSTTSDTFTRVVPFAQCITGDHRKQEAFTPCAALQTVAREAKICSYFPGPAVDARTGFADGSGSKLEAKGQPSTREVEQALDSLLCVAVKADSAKPSPVKSKPDKDNAKDDKARRGVMQVQCYYCGRHAWHAHTPKLMACSRCHKVKYCSKECQAADWKGWHKAECRGYAAAADGSQVPSDRVRALTVPGDVQARIPMPIPTGCGIYSGITLTMIIGGPFTGVVTEKTTVYPYILQVNGLTS